MSSPITFSGFNGIDFSSVVNAIMAADSVPLTNLQTQQSNLQGQVSQYTTLASQLSTVQSAADALSTSSGIASYTTSSTDSTAATATASPSAVPGHYDVVVQQLARSQVMASATTAPDANSTIVATGGSLSINGTAVTITQPVTLQGLADTINGTSGSPVTASVVQTSANAYRLVLTANASGTTNAFTVSNALTGGTNAVGFTDTDGDGISGNSTADNAVQAADAKVLVNNVSIVSSSNVLTSAIPGATLQLSKQDPNTTIGVDITADSSTLRNNLSNFISAYNSFVSYASSQVTAAAGGDGTSIGRDPVFRQLTTSLRSAMTTAYSNSGSLGYLAQLGVEFTQSGTLQLNSSVFQSAVAKGTSDAVSLLAGTDAAPGAFASVDTLLSQFTQTSGLLSTTQQQLNAQISRVGTQISDMQSRLALEKASLTAEFTAADLAMSDLQSQSGALSGVGSSLTSSSSSSSSSS